MADHSMTLLLALDVLVTIAWICSIQAHRAALPSLSYCVDDVEREAA